MKAWLVDTGPLVALLDADDAHHAWAVEQAKAITSVVATCEAVVAETLFLLHRKGCRGDDVFELVEAGFLRCDFDFRQEHRQVRKLMRSYQDQPMSFADACLVRMAELRPEACVWTLDRDFKIYRLHRRQTISLVSPW